MATITLRSVKGSPLTNAEVDANFSNINTELGTKLSATGGTLTGGITVPSVTLSGSGGEPGVATLTWNDTAGTLDLGLKGGNVTMQIGEELFLRVTNSTGSAIPKGSVVYITGSTGNHVNVVLAQANSESTSSKTLGITAETIANAQTGFVATNGIVSGLDTSTLTEGGAVWLSATVAGGLTSTRPSPSNHAVLIGWCVKSHASVGALYIHIANGYEVAELHDVLLTSIANNQVLSYESASGLWKNRSLATVANTGAFSDILSKPTTLSGYGITDAPTVTGTGASGTWGISITGNAATATRLINLRTINGVGFDGTADITIADSTKLPLSGGTLTGPLSAPNFRDGAGAFNVNLGSGGTEGRGVAAGYSGGAYGGIGYNVRHTATSEQYIAPTGDTVSYLRFDGGGFRFFSAAAGAAGRTVTFSAPGNAHLDASGNWYTAGQMYATGSQHLVLNTGNYNSYSPTLTGGGASGTWSINITGGAGLLSALGNYVLNASTNGRDFANGIQAGFVDSGTNGYPNYGSIVRIKTYPNDGGTAELYFPYGPANGGTSMRYRLGQYNNAGWTSWKTVLDDSNYNSYAPTLGGTGATGTWGISITGNAATVTNGIYRNTTNSGWAYLTGSTQGTPILRLNQEDTGSGYYLLQGLTGGSEVMRIERSGTIVSPTGRFQKNQTAGNYTTAAIWTESYGNTTTGVAFHISGNVGKFLEMRTDGILYWNGDTMLHSGNYSSWALPLSGGTLTGALTVGTTGSTSQTRALRVAPTGTNPGSFGSYAGSWRSTIEIWDNAATRMLHLTPPDGTNYNYSSLKSIDAGLKIDVGGSGGTNAVTFEANGVANFPQGLQQGGNQVLHFGNYTSYNGILRALGGLDGINFNTTNYNSMYYGYIENSPNKPTSYSYNYGTILTFDPGLGVGGRAQFYISHAGNDLIFRGGWSNNDSWYPWNKVLTNQNYTSYSPSLTGSGASGTWGISITGNSDTVDGLHASSFSRKDTTNQWIKPYYEYTQNLTTETPSTLASQMGGGGLRVDFMSPSYTGSGGWNHVITFSGYNYYNMYQIGAHYDGGTGTDLWVRSEANHGGSSWTAWRKLLNSVNYNSYSPTLTGGGASGTWGINITGNAAGLSGGATINNANFNGIMQFPSGGGGATFASNHYSMGKDIANGSWSHPHYSDLIIGYHTGIRIGASYSGIRFYNNSPTTDANNDGNGDQGEALLMTIGGHAGGTGVIVNNTLNVGGVIYSPSYGASSGNTTTRYTNPRGGASSWNGSVTGAIKIRLPFRANDNMWRMKVYIYNYGENTMWEYHIGNYAYSAGGYNSAASCICTGNATPLTVRWGNDGSYDCVWIGETSTGWSYPFVSVTDFGAGYANAASAQHQDSWDISYVASFGTVATSYTPLANLASGSMVAGNAILHAGNYNSYSPTLTGGNASGTWGINITGNAGSAYGLAVHGGRNNEANKVVRTDGNGYLQTGYINSSNGDENNASSPARVWGTNGSDSYLRTYQTGSLSVGTATNGRYVYDNGAYSGSAAYREASSMHVYYAYLGRLVYNNGAYSGSGWIEPSDLGVRYAARSQRANGNFYIDDNYGNGIVGVYASTRYQGVFAMGDSYKLPADGTSAGNLYGLAWSYPSAGGVAGNLDSHGLLVLINGGLGSAISYSIVAAGNVTAYSDERLKTNWRPMPENFVERLAQVKVGIYDRIDGEQITQVGIGAQSFQRLLPEAITKAKDEMGTLSVSYGNAAMASAVELAKEIVAIKRELEALKARLH